MLFLFRIWDNSLAVSAQRKGDGCPTEPEHATTVRDLAADDFLTDTDFPVLGEMYGYTTLEVMPNEYYERTGFYTILWPKMTKLVALELHIALSKFLSFW
uniref:Uncharacterized protein n=1 Tax=Caenorhabditis japonica TaxID=281687 RepID=A0A8R1IJ93_CAEJA